MSRATDVFDYQMDADGIVTVTMNMTGSVNAMNAEYRTAMSRTVERLQAQSQLRGVILASAKKVFFAGGDLTELLAVKPGDEAQFMAILGDIKSQLRALELLPVPVVAAINGAALGGGFEICLAANYRIAVNHNSVQLGLPEVTLGLLPGGGGVVRMVNLVGVEAALPYLLEGKRISSKAALDAGLVHQLVETQADLLGAAKRYLLEHKSDDDAALQPWDKPGFTLPGGRAGSPKLAQLIAVAPAMLQQKTRGLLPAPEAILDCAIEASRLDFDTALRVESRALTRLVVSPQAKNMITAFFFQLNQVNGGASRPQQIAPRQVSKVGVIGAGMMGQGIAYVSAAAGIEVVLKDVSLAAAEKAKAYSVAIVEKLMARGKMSTEKAQQLLSLISPSASDEDLSGCDLIIEAVFESIDLKSSIVKSSEQYLTDNGVWGSNTSSLPITQLAQSSTKPENFIGIHFFSPVEKMPLVEIICGEKTNDTTLALAFDYARQINKTPIVVNDSLGFFTSRTFSTYLDEAARLVCEGIHPLVIDNGGKAIGMPVGPLTVHDEVSLELTRKVHETWAAMGVANKWGEQLAMLDVMQTLLVDNDRGGKHYGGGYFDYDKHGKKSIWPGLLAKYYQPEVHISSQDLHDRLLFRQVIETLKCLESGVLRSVADGNIGSIMGIGAPVHTGGFLQFVNSYGLPQFQQRCDQLTALFGERFSCPQLVLDKIANGQTFT